MFFFQGKLFIGKVLKNTRNFVLFTCAEHQNNSKTDLTYHQYHKICGRLVTEEKEHKK